ncbi:hypothetical protein J2D73_19960 [Acetobacter sacchari]|uniref:Uncharacterized protein n=1 Tax=Acetobacter sacchari TaxID=2661687 RepID=A0ABS3M1S4_9PROT|nr:hypothetical protein [Acetobacter sacchari]MBO1362060.1 hypothetical protein [Acetobacter sacchari]
MTEKQWDGRPQEPERDGWHWLGGSGGSMSIPFLWQASSQFWASGNRFAISPHVLVDEEFTYEGPCPTPADLAARDAATIERCAVACEGVAEEWIADGFKDYGKIARGCAKAVRALKTQEPS